MNFILTLEETKNAYHSAWGMPNPHIDGLNAIAVAQTAKIKEYEKETGIKIYQGTRETGWGEEG